VWWVGLACWLVAIGWAARPLGIDGQDERAVTLKHLVQSIIRLRHLMRLILPVYHFIPGVTIQ
jgi:hypothetical protein